MSFKTIRKIPSAEEIIDLIPLSNEYKKIKAIKDQAIKDIIEGNSDKFLLIIGPCSADDEDSVCDYVHRLAIVQEKVKDSIVIVPRIYTNKPRTTGEGYKGMLHQPNPEEASNILAGIKSIRNLHVRCIKESGLTSADEMLYPDNLVYFEDMLSYIAVGARSVENQQHRLASSGISLPVGMKNPMSGDLNVMLNSIQAAQGSHNFIYQGCEVETSGNPLSHGILRGSVNKHGEHITNYHYEDLCFAYRTYAARNLINPMIVIDTNHSNSAKKFQCQPRIAREILFSRRYNPSVKKLVRGLLIESYIEEGNQKVDGHVYGKSITDSCLGWTATEELIYYIAENL